MDLNMDLQIKEDNGKWKSSASLIDYDIIHVVFIVVLFSPNR